jgi:hypothetical protein
MRLRIVISTLVVAAVVAALVVVCFMVADPVGYL